MKNEIDDLRTHLFETLQALKDKDAPMQIERAQVIAEVAQVIVNTAKVECDFIKFTGAKGSGFIPLPAPEDAAPKPGQPRLIHGRDNRG